MQRGSAAARALVSHACFRPRRSPRLGLKNIIAPAENSRQPRAHGGDHPRMAAEACPTGSADPSRCRISRTRVFLVAFFACRVCFYIIRCQISCHRRLTFDDKRTSFAGLCQSHCQRGGLCKNPTIKNRPKISLLLSGLLRIAIINNVPCIGLG